MLLTTIHLFFRGDIDLIDRLDEGLQVLKMECANNILPPSVDIHLIAPEINEEDQVIIQDGQFKTTSRFHDYLPIESEYAYIRIVKPLAWGRHEPKHKPMVLVLPGTGEKGFGRRYDGVCLPLARLGVASIILEGPFYGLRKPKKQNGCKLRHVSDLPLLGAATIEEVVALRSFPVVPFAAALFPRPGNGTSGRGRCEYGWIARCYGRSAYPLPCRNGLFGGTSFSSSCVYISDCVNKS